MEGKSLHGNTLMQLLKGRWVMVVMSFYILSCSGATYIFGIYSGAIKEELRYNQETIDTLGFFKDLGSSVGIVSGLMNEVLPAWMVLTVGALMNLFGYLMIWLAVTHRIAQPPIWQMNLFLCIGANSQTFANTGVLVTFVKNFPQGRGEVVGIIKGCVGLSGAIFTQIYLAVYGQDTRGVILLIGWVPSLVTLVFMFFIRPITPAYNKHEKRNFYYFLYLALALAAFLMVAIIVENQIKHFPSLAYKVIGAITVFLVISNMVIGIRAENAFMAQVEERGLTKDKMLQELSTTPKKLVGVKSAESHEDGKSSNISHPDHDVHSHPLAQHNVISQKGKNSFESHDVKSQEGSADSVENPGRTPSKITDPTPFSKGEHVSKSEILSRKPTFTSKFKLFFKNWPQRGEDFTIPQALLSLDMWILFVSLTCGVGATLTAIDNMGQIGESLGYSKVSISTFVSLISIWNFLGRVVAGFVSEILLRRYHFPRTLMLTLALSMACVGHLLIAFPAPNTLYIASIMVGFCFGAQLPLLFAIVSELFGLKYYATLHTVGGLASPLGSYLLSVRVAGNLYDREAVRQNDQALILASTDGAMASAPAAALVHGDLKCMGPECFRLTFLIMTIVSGFGSLVSTLLVFRTKKFYSQDIYSKFNVKPDSKEDQNAQCENGH